MKSFLINILKIIGGMLAVFVVLCIVLVAIAVNSPQATPRAADAQTTSGSSNHRQASRPAKVIASHDYCDEALAHERTAASDGISHQAAYNAAVAGLADNEHCSNDDQHLINEGYLLSMKGMAEHYLKDGDSQTDLNQANALLVECQTRPGIYGTHTGAACETQEMNNIKAPTNWEMESYER
jgi:hypothetical protein